jgi:hypothetical protein
MKNATSSHLGTTKGARSPGIDGRLIALVARTCAVVLLATIAAGCGAGRAGSTRIGTATESSGERTSPGDPVIAAAGDIACSARETASERGSVDRCVMEATSDLLLDAPLQAVLELGDAQYETGRLGDFRRVYAPSWGRLRAITYPTLGNHEYLTPGASGYFKYFGSRAGHSARGYYSFDIGAWHLISLNSNCAKAGGGGSSSPQGGWLAHDLSPQRARCTLAFWHHPRFSSGNHGDQVATAPFWEELYAAGADVVLAGHDHDYERFPPLDPAGRRDKRRGIREFVVGTGGSNHTAFRRERQVSVVRNDDTYGVLMLTLHARGYQWRFVPSRLAFTNFTDAGTGTCH